MKLQGRTLTKPQTLVIIFYENTLKITLKMFILITGIMRQRIQRLNIYKDVNIEIKIVNMAA